MCRLEIIPADLLKQDPQLILTGLWHLELLSFSALILFLVNFSSPPGTPGNSLLGPFPFSSSLSLGAQIPHITTNHMLMKLMLLIFSFLGTYPIKTILLWASPISHRHLKTTDPKPLFSLRTPLLLIQNSVSHKMYHLWSLQSHKPKSDPVLLYWPLSQLNIC